jgi:hypothetical protein
MRDPVEVVHRHNQLVAIMTGKLDVPGLAPLRQIFPDDPNTELFLETALSVLAWVVGEDRNGGENFAATVAHIDEFGWPAGRVLVLGPNGRPVSSDAAEGQRCEVCGCTEFSACRTPEGPCHWVQPGLCSGCASSETVTAAHEGWQSEVPDMNAKGAI